MDNSLWGLLVHCLYLPEFLKPKETYHLSVVSRFFVDCARYKTSWVCHAKSLKAFAKGLAYDPRIQRLQMIQYYFEESAANTLHSLVIKYPEVFKRVQRLDMRYNYQLFRCVSMVSSLRDITCLLLDCTGMTSSHAIQMGNVFSQTCFSLEHLSMDMNTLESHGFKSLMEGLCTKPRRLKHLSFRDCCIQSTCEITSREWAGYLVYLDLHGNEIQDLGVSSWILYAGCSLPLQYIDFGTNVVTNLLSLSCSVKILGLAKTGLMSPLGAIIKAETFSSLRTLNISHNSLYDSGMVELCGLLQNTCYFLQELYAGNTRMSERGAQAVWELLAIKPHMRTLSMFENYFGDLWCIRHLCTVLLLPGVGKQLHVLDMEDCLLWEQSVKVLMRCLEENPDMLPDVRWIGLSGNDTADHSSIQQMYHRCPARREKLIIDY